jgi:hypothetical protein
MLGCVSYAVRDGALYQLLSSGFDSPGVLYIHISVTTLVVPALALENYCCTYVGTCRALYFIEVPTDSLNHFWAQVAVSLLTPPHGGFRSETAVTARRCFGSETVTHL